MRGHVILSVFKRNFKSYFSGVLGYLFIVVFVVAGAAAAFGPRFFADNEPNLDHLSEWFPWLLLFVIPAVTMGTWADERRQGTDELLFTLPGSDREILLGKYLSVLAVYSVVLLFSLSHVVAVCWMGTPDLGQLFATFVGYFLAGAALLAAGMLASSLTNSPTVAFVLGVVFCALPIFIGDMGELLVNLMNLVPALGSVSEFFNGIVANDFVNSLSLREQMRDFGIGVLPLSGILYFVGFAIFMLYLNYVVITKRHWQSSERKDMGWQYGLRTICLGAILVSVCSVMGYFAIRGDLTRERLFSLSEATQKALGSLKTEKPVTVQAFISPDVPSDYVAARKQLIGLLRQYDRKGGGALDVRFVDVEPYSEAADQAKHFGISPVTVMDDVDGNRTQKQVFLGAVIQSSSDDIVVPFFGKGLPIEYELTRSIQTVARTERLTVGVLKTDANVMQWQIVTELKKQYEVEEVVPDSSIALDKYDVLLVVMPSSLTDPEMAHLVEYVKAGRATLIFDDPCPMMFGNQFGMITNAPRLSKPRQGGMMGMGSPPPTPKHRNGTAGDLIEALDILWDNGRTVFDVNNPHSEFAMLPPEYVFLTTANNADTFSTDSEITSGLQEMVTIYSGSLRKANRNDDLEFLPLLITGSRSGLISWEDYTQQSFNPMTMSPATQIKQNVIHRTDKYGHVLAAHIKSEKDGSEMNAVFVSDIDMIADMFFSEWNRGDLPVQFDNVTFVLNAVDVLANESSFIKLRTRRPTHRTLERVESATVQFKKARVEEEKAAEEEMQDRLEETRASFATRRKEIEENSTLDRQSRNQIIEQIRSDEERKLEVTEANLQNRKSERIERVKALNERKIRSTQGWFRLLATGLPALPPLLIGLIVFGFRKNREQSTITAARRR